MGAISAVCESARNIVCSGGKPLAVTNCLNFGNPYKLEIYYGFSEVIAGMGEACRILGTPVTGGNVSFYNEDPERAVFPTPVIGMVGLVEDISHITTQTFKDDGDAILLVGENKNELGASEYLHALFNQTKGKVPPIDLEYEKNLQSALLAAIQKGIVKSAHDCSEGGLAVAVSECCISERENMVGASIKISDEIRSDCLLFGETQSRVILSCGSKNENELIVHFEKHGISCKNIGTTGSDRLSINDMISVDLKKMAEAFFNALPQLMDKVA